MQSRPAQWQQWSEEPTFPVSLKLAPFLLILSAPTPGLLGAEKSLPCLSPSPGSCRSTGLVHDIQDSAPMPPVRKYVGG